MSTAKTLQLHLLRFLACAAIVCMVIYVLFKIVPANPTTVALIFLLIVLAAATRWGFAEAIFTSVLAMLGFNFFFLPPVGTLTIADPQNWVALCVFLITAAVASQLSARAKRRAEEALVRQRETERLYAFSRAILMDEPADLIRLPLLAAGRLFGLEHVSFYDCSTEAVNGSLSRNVTSEILKLVAATGEPILRPVVAVVPVRLGTRIIGSLALEGADLTLAERESIAGLFAINYERARALDHAATAEAARRGERLKTSLLDNVAHDLNTPLTAIKTCVTTLISVPPGSDEHKQELLEIIDEETTRLQRTIADAVQLARLESEKIVLERESVNIRKVIVEVLKTLPDSHHYSLPESPNVTISVDVKLVQQALRQLLENARKYSPPDTKIEVRIEAGQDQPAIHVADHGPGIDPADLDHIFEKYYRGRRVGNSEGTGMGLAIAQGIIEAHGGKIWAKNRPEGGAEFSFTLPFQPQT